ncbi:MAG: hypothetical protein AAGG50_06880 [Bacteroidota bacterium]
MTDYTPIACGFHDRLEHWAVRREPITLVWRTGLAADAPERAACVRIADLFAKDDADWVRLVPYNNAGCNTEGDGAPAEVIIRADQVVSAEGHRLAQAC